MFNNTFTQSLVTAIKSKNPIVNIVTDDYDNDRLERHLEAVAEMTGRNLLIWNMAQGMVMTVGDGLSNEMEETLSQTTELDSILDFLSQSYNAKASIFYLQDLGYFMQGDGENIMIVRTVFHLSRLMKKSQSVIVTSDSDSLNGFCNIELPLPDTNELEGLCRKMVDALPAKIGRSNLTDTGYTQIAIALSGLNEVDAKSTLASVIVSKLSISDSDAAEIAGLKAQKLGDLECLEIVQSNISFSEVGGLSELKTWVSRRKGGFSQEGRDFGLATPKGVVLLGIPGTGKSLAAKAIASEMALPLVSFDIGAIFGGLVGQSESNMRKALAVLETLAPVVLWIDEIDKAISQNSDGDSGTSKRVLGKLLTWLQETDKVFVVATGNNPHTIPTELLRKGRFDETFFIGLPDHSSRMDIFSVHLGNIGRDCANFDLYELADLSEGFTGAEIEAAIKESLYIAFESGSELTTEHVTMSLGEIAPQSETHRDMINLLNDWAAKGNCRMADKSVAPKAKAKAQPVMSNVSEDKDFDLEF